MNRLTTYSWQVIREKARTICTSCEATSKPAQNVVLCCRCIVGSIVGKQSPRIGVRRCKRVFGSSDWYALRAECLQSGTGSIEQVFDLKWVQANTPIPWGRIATVASVIISVIALIAAILIIRAQQENRISVEISNLRKVSGAMTILTGEHIAWPRYADVDLTEARRFFFDDEVDRPTRIALFAGMDKEKDSYPDVQLVVDCLLPGLEQKLASDPAEGPVADALCCTVARIDLADGREICMKLGRPYGCGPQ